jgi:hypothetical protein
VKINEVIQEGIGNWAKGWGKVGNNLAKSAFGMDRNDTWTGQNGLVPGVGKYVANRAQSAANAKSQQTASNTSTSPAQSATDTEELTGKNVPKLVQLKSGREGVQFQGKIYVTGDDGRWVVFGSNKPVSADLQTEFDHLIGYTNTGGANTAPPAADSEQQAAPTSFANKSNPAQSAPTPTRAELAQQNKEQGGQYYKPPATDTPPTAKARISRKADGSVTVTDKNGIAWTKSPGKDLWSDGKNIFMPGSEQYDALNNFNQNLKEAGL